MFSLFIIRKTGINFLDFGCGNSRVISFTVCEKGYSGPNCRESCDCGSKGECEPITGSCKCPPGLTGLGCTQGM